MNKENDDLSHYYDKDTFKAFEALSSRPHVNQDPHVEETVKENAKEVWNLITDPKTYVYLAGLSSLENKLDKVLSEMAGSEQAWQEKKQQLIKEHRWSTLLYD